MAEGSSFIAMLWRITWSTVSCSSPHRKIGVGTLGTLRQCRNSRRPIMPVRICVSTELSCLRSPLSGDWPAVQLAVHWLWPARAWVWRLALARRSLVEIAVQALRMRSAWPDCFNRASNSASLRSRYRSSGEHRRLCL